jgi:hypothetical protein
MNIYRLSRGRYQWFIFSLYFVPRGHKGSRPKPKNYKTGGSGGGCGSEVSHWIMIATCSFLHRNQPFFYD